MKSHGLLLAGSLLVVVGCYDEGKFGRFDQAVVLQFAVEEQRSPAVIDRDELRIDVSVTEDAKLRSLTLTTLEVSSLARTNWKVGDVLDLRAAEELVVTAEDGSKVSWTVTATKPEPPPVQDGGKEDSGGAQDGGASCESFLMTYQLTGLFQLTDTPGGLGNGEFVVGPGEMTLRFVPTGPGSAVVTVVAYTMPQFFVVEAPGAKTTTDSQASAGPDECGLARGLLSGGLVTWDACDYGPAPPLGTTRWGPGDIVGGPGCVANYTVEGTVSCVGPFCSASGVDFPIQLDDLYPQPLNSFEFNDDFTSVSMKGLGADPSNPGILGVELPNQEPSRSWIGLDGTQVSKECAPLPSCGT